MPIDIIQNIEKGVLPNTATTQLFLMDVEKFLDALPMQPIFDLVVTSPPYNIGKEYENQVPLSDYYDWQKRIIEKIYPRLKDNGSICWQVGNYVENGSITPLDIELAPIFKELSRMPKSMGISLNPYKNIRKTSGITTTALSLFAMIISSKKIAFLSETFL